jgi:hypothetical protein
MTSSTSEVRQIEAIEILCLYRLFSSLLGRGWDTLSEPIRTLLHSANF